MRSRFGSPCAFCLLISGHGHRAGAHQVATKDAVSCHVETSYAWLTPNEWTCPIGFYSPKPPPNIYGHYG
eukprot:1751078-Prymnesium_polylepis.1